MSAISPGSPIAPGDYVPGAGASWETSRSRGRGPRPVWHPSGMPAGCGDGDASMIPVVVAAARLDHRLMTLNPPGKLTTHRMKFDLITCSHRPDDSSWRHRIRPIHHVPSQMGNCHQPRWQGECAAPGAGPSWETSRSRGRGPKPVWHPSGIRMGCGDGDASMIPVVVAAARLDHRLMAMKPSF